MTTVRDVLGAMDDFAPRELALAGDNIGLLAGDADAVVTRVLVALDASQAVIDEAMRCGAQLLVVHHPILRGLNAINGDSYDGSRVLHLLNANVACISMHTNLDACDGGINERLAHACRLVDVQPLDETQLTRVGTVAGALTASAYAQKVAEVLGCKALRFCDGGRPVCRVAVGSGNSTSDYDKVVAAGCDTFVTGDVRYHLWLEAKERGINLIDAGHYETEALICQPVRDYLAARFPALDVVVAQSMALPYAVL